MKDQSHPLLLDISNSSFPSFALVFSKYSELLKSSNPALPQSTGATSSIMMMARKKPMDCVIQIMTAITELSLEMSAQKGFRKIAAGIAARTMIKSNLPMNFQERRV